LLGLRSTAGPRSRAPVVGHLTDSAHPGGDPPVDRRCAAWPSGSASPLACWRSC